MNAWTLLDAMTDISDEQVLSAQQRLLDKPQTARPLRLKRLLLLSAAILAIMAATLATAMAVSPELRAFVREIFHTGQLVETPHLEKPLTPETMYVEPSPEDELLRAQRVHIPVASHARNGVFLLCTDEVEMRQGSPYDAYYAEDGKLLPLEQQHFRHYFSLYGTECSLEWDWVEHENMPTVTWIDPNQPIRIPYHGGPASAALVQVLLPQTGSWYPVLLNFHTGQVTDILAGTGAEQLSRIDQAAISPDGSKLLLGQLTDDAYLLYYVDVASKTLYSLDALFGQHIDACSLIDNMLACWSCTDGSCTAWTLNLGTMETSLLFEGKPDAFAPEQHGTGLVFLMGFDSLHHWGEMYAGSRFALETDADRKVSVIDLKTGLATPLEGFIWPGNAERIPSPDGKKLLIAAGEDGMDLEYIGILDIEQQRLTEFAQDHGVLGEFGPYWFDLDTVAVQGSVDSDSLSADYFLYQLPTQKEG